MKQKAWNIFSAIPLTTIAICVLTLIFCSLSSCKKEETIPTIYLTDDDKAWNIYHVTDTFKFINDYGNIRKYVVTNIETGITPYTNFSYRIENYHEYISIDLNRPDTTDPINIYIVRGYNQTSPSKFEIFCNWPNLWGFMDINTTGTLSLTVNNINYTNVGLRETVNNGPKVFYQKQYGIIRFDEANNGTVWGRIY